MEEWNYQESIKVGGIYLAEYTIAENSTGNMDDLLHPTARYTCIKKSFAPSKGHNHEYDPILVVKGSRMGMPGLRVKPFNLIILSAFSGQLDISIQEKRLNSLVDYLKER